MKHMKLFPGYISNFTHIRKNQNQCYKPPSKTEHGEEKGSRPNRTGQILVI
jgi:hypothetical protein